MIKIRENISARIFVIFQTKNWSHWSKNKGNKFLIRHCLALRRDSIGVLRKNEYCQYQNRKTVTGDWIVWRARGDREGWGARLRTVRALIDLKRSIANSSQSFFGSEAAQVMWDMWG